MFVMCSRTKIGNVSFDAVNDIAIKRSMHQVNATATIKLPVTSRLVHSGVPGTRIETAQAFGVGDPVEISLGYNNGFQLEFKGYVKQVNFKTPLEVVCEDAFYLTRQTNLVISEQQATLKQVLNTILKGLNINLAHCIDLTLKNFIVDNKPASWVLNKLKTEYGLTIFFDVENNLYVGKAYDIIGETVKYRMRYNVIKDDDLQYRLASDVRLKVKAVCFYADGSKVEASLGADGGEQKTLYYYDVESQGQLAALAQAELQRFSYDGFSGKIQTFLQPFAVPGMVAAIEDEVYPQRNGNYYIESVNVQYGTSGARRTVEIGLKI